MTHADVTWMDLALCAEIGPEPFFPTKGEKATVARKICNQCEVRQQCLDWALDAPQDEQHGVYGGVHASSRRNQIKADKETAS